MIAKFIGGNKGCRGVSDYLEAEHHDAHVLVSTLGAPLTPPRAIGRAHDEDLEHLHNLTRYVDQSAKTQTLGRRISPEAIAEMERRAALRPDLERTWIHAVISYGIADRPDVDDQMLADDAKDFVHHLVQEDNRWKEERAIRRGFRQPEPVDADTIQVIAVVHREKRHIHTHLLMSRIDAEGNAYSGWNNHHHAREWCVAKEVEHGFTRTRLHAIDLDEHGAVRVHDPERKPTAEIPLTPAQAIRQEIEDVADRSIDREDLTERLAAHGLRLEAGDGAAGWTISDTAGTRINASRAGLTGRRSPLRIGGGLPIDVAKDDFRTAARSSADWDGFVAALSKTGLQLELDKRGTVVSIHRVDVVGNKMSGRTWRPDEFGIKYPPNAHRWKPPAARTKDRDERGDRQRHGRGGPDRRGNDGGTERPGRQSNPEPTTPILLVPPAGDRRAELRSLRQERDAIVAKRAAARAAEQEAARARIEARRAAQQAAEQQRLAQEESLAKQRALAASQAQDQVRQALADDRPAADNDRQLRTDEPSRPESTPSTSPVDLSASDTVPDEPPKPFRMDR